MGKLLLYSTQERLRKPEPAVREAQLRPTFLEKFKNMDQEDQQAILEKMRRCMNERTNNELKSIRSPMLKAKYDLLESQIKTRPTSKFANRVALNNSSENLVESELITRAQTKKKGDNDGMIAAVMQTDRKNIRR
jgi:hypothetical protein